MRRTPLLLLPFLFAAHVHAQTAPATRPMPKNIERSLSSPMTLDADNSPMAEFANSLRAITGCNIVINWNALAKAGITRETPITLHLKECTFEAAVRTFCETAPASTSRLNYVVGDNTLVITTNAELGKGAAPRIYKLSRILGEDENKNVPVLETLLKAELARAGEPMDLPPHALGIKNGNLIASVSDRGHTVLTRAVDLLNVPTAPGQHPQGLAVTAVAKRGQEALKALGPATPDLFLAIAKEPAKYQAKINLALLPATADELQKDKPALAGTITDGGILLIGPAGALRQRTQFAAYELKTVLQRAAVKSKTKPAPGVPELAAQILAELQQKVPPDAAGGTWGEPGKSPAAMTAIDTTLAVFATPDVQRQLSTALQRMAN